MRREICGRTRGIKKTFRHDYRRSKSKIFLKSLMKLQDLKRSFNFVNDVLKRGVQSITDLMVRPGMIALRFCRC